jgi:membrane protease YdiL (CAAX protease family)
MDVAVERFALEDVSLFARLSESRREALRQHISVRCFAAGECVFSEGEPNLGRLYVVLEGEVSICNRGKALSTHTMGDYEIAVLGKDRVLGAVAFLDGGVFASSAFAKTPLTVAMLDFSGPTPPEAQKLRPALVAELRRKLTMDARASVSDRLGSLEQEAEFARYKHAMARIVVTTLALLSAYTLLLGLLPLFMVALTVNFAISPFVIVLFAAFLGPVILNSGFPPSFFGLQTANWKSALAFSVAASLAFIAAGAALKWTLIHTTATFAGLSLFGIADVKVGMHDAMMSPLYWVAVGLYLLLTPLQEFVARSCLQAPLYAFLDGPDSYRKLWSILVSNLVFAAAHSHISFAFAMTAFVPGLFWGWIFARTNSLLAAAASHFMIGGAGIFLFGIEEVVKRLMS